MSWDNNNLACILIFPPWQRQGLGKILMGVSYELSKREGYIGGPEKPLSELGSKGYVKFWQARIVNVILGLKRKSTLTVEELATLCWLLPEDTIAALKNTDIMEQSNKAHGGLAVSKAGAREWAVKSGIDLTSPTSAEGFIEDAMPSKGHDER